MATHTTAHPPTGRGSEARFFETRRTWHLRILPVPSEDGYTHWFFGEACSPQLDAWRADQTVTLTTDAYVLAEDVLTVLRELVDHYDQVRASVRVNCLLDALAGAALEPLELEGDGLVVRSGGAR